MSRECGCPDFVVRCSHYAGLAVWLITQESSRAECRKRGFDPGKPCPVCGSVTTISGAAAGVFCGFVDSPACLCRNGMVPVDLDTFDLDFRDNPPGQLFKTQDAALSRFAELELRLIEGAP